MLAKLIKNINWIDNFLPVNTGDPQKNYIAQSARAVEYTDCTSAER